MDRPAADFARILEIMCSHSVEFIVVGGVGAVLQGLPALLRIKEELGREKDRASLAVLRRTIEESQRGAE